jgi:hypothetical protein
MKSLDFLEIPVTDHIITNNRISTLPIGAGDVVLVAATGSINVAGARAIDSAGSSGAKITIVGTVMNTGSFAAIETQSSNIVVSGKVSSERTAVFQGSSGNTLKNSGDIIGSIAVEMGGNGSFGNKLYNEGSLVGTVDHGVLSVGDGLIVNSGSITGVKSGLHVSGQVCTIVNSGAIIGTDRSAIRSTSGTMVIQNNGHLEGGSWASSSSTSPISTTGGSGRSEELFC